MDTTMIIQAVGAALAFTLALLVVRRFVTWLKSSALVLALVGLAVVVVVLVGLGLWSSAKQAEATRAAATAATAATASGTAGYLVLFGLFVLILAGLAVVALYIWLRIEQARTQAAALSSLVVTRPGGTAAAIPGQYQPERPQMYIVDDELALDLHDGNDWLTVQENEPYQEQGYSNLPDWR